MKINSRYVSVTFHKGHTRLIALKDFVVSFKIQKEQYSFEVKKGDIGGILSDDSEIIDNVWIGYESKLADGCCIINSYILDNSKIKQATIINSTISDSGCWSSIIDSSTIYNYSRIKDSGVSKTTACNCDFYDCNILESNAAMCSFNKVTLSRVNISDFTLISVSLLGHGTLNINKENTIVFKNFWSSGRYFLYHIPTRTWYVGCFKGNSEALLRKAIADSEEKYEMYKKYVDFVQNMIPA